MQKKRRSIAVIISLWLAFSILIPEIKTVYAAPPESVPKDMVQVLLSKVKAMRKAAPDENIFLTPEQVQRNEALAVEINRMLDIDYIGAYALLDYWKKLNEKDQGRFLSTFTELLSKVAYPNAGKFLEDLEIKIRKEKILKKRAMVYTSVIHEEEGRIDIDFKLLATSTTWVIVDVYLDEVSLVRNLRTQCLKIIRDHSFDELCLRMQKKIDERDTANLKEVTGRN
jgi:phospholipid transport system substrate-binding protein